MIKRVPSSETRVVSVRSSITSSRSLPEPRRADPAANTPQATPRSPSAETAARSSATGCPESRQPDTASTPSPARSPSSPQPRVSSEDGRSSRPPLSRDLVGESGEAVARARRRDAPRTRARPGSGGVRRRHRSRGSGPRSRKHSEQQARSSATPGRRRGWSGTRVPCAGRGCLGPAAAHSPACSRSNFSCPVSIPAPRDLGCREETRRHRNGSPRLPAPSRSSCPSSVSSSRCRRAARSLISSPSATCATVASPSVTTASSARSRSASARTARLVPPPHRWRRRGGRRAPPASRPAGNGAEHPRAVGGEQVGGGPVELDHDVHGAGERVRAAHRLPEQPWRLPVVRDEQHREPARGGGGERRYRRVHVAGVVLGIAPESGPLVEHIDDEHLQPVPLAVVGRSRNGRPVVSAAMSPKTRVDFPTFGRPASSATAPAAR